MISYVKASAASTTAVEAPPVRTGRRAPKTGPRKVTRPQDVTLRRYVRACTPGVRIAAFSSCAG